MLLSSKQVRRRYGDCSDMALWRWLHDDELRFPKPLYIRRRRFWQSEELDAFDVARAAASSSEAV